ncbi:hypothetical protein ACU686_01530 [Yinghuangia aomiensis]
MGRYLAFLDGLGRRDPADVTAADVAAYAGALRTGDDHGPALAESSAARGVVAVRGLHKFWLREGRVERDAAGEIAPPAPAVAAAESRAAGPHRGAAGGRRRGGSAVRTA